MHHRPGVNPAVRAVVALLAAATAYGQAQDTYVPWEGGAAYYSKWSNGPRHDADFFPITVWLQDPALAEEYKAIGVNVFVGLWRGPTEEQLQQLTRAGMAVLAGRRRQSPVEGPLSAIIRGWTLMDEPDNAQAKPGGGWGSCVLPPVIAGQAEQHRAADATRPVFLNLGQGVINEKWRGRGEFCGQHPEHYPEYISSVDIVSYDVYPVNSDLPLWYVPAGVDRLRKWANYQKAVWNFIETTAIRGKGKPSPDQIKAEVWMSIIHGSMGIGYFCHQFRPVEDAAAPLHDPVTKKALADINRQIAALAPVLNTRPVANGVAVASSNPASPIDTMLNRHAGSTYLFAAGARPGGKTTARFTLRDAGNVTAEVLGEGRSVAVRGGVLEDGFADYQVHIYKLAFDPNGRTGRRR